MIEHWYDTIAPNSAVVALATITVRLCRTPNFRIPHQNKQDSRPLKDLARGSFPPLPSPSTLYHPLSILHSLLLTSSFHPTHHPASTTAGWCNAAIACVCVCVCVSISSLHLYKSFAPLNCLFGLKISTSLAQKKYNSCSGYILFVRNGSFEVYGGEWCFACYS